jgi:hypothetical protein
MAQFWATLSEYWQWFVALVAALAGLMGITAKTRYDAKSEALAESQRRADEIIEQGRRSDEDVANLPDDAALDELRRDWSAGPGSGPGPR